MATAAATHQLSCTLGGISCLGGSQCLGNHRTQGRGVRFEPLAHVLRVRSGVRGLSEPALGGSSSLA